MKDKYTEAAKFIMVMIAAKRKSAHIKQRELASSINYSISKISAKEIGHCKTTMQDYLAICDALHIDPAEHLRISLKIFNCEDKNG